MRIGRSVKPADDAKRGLNGFSFARCFFLLFAWLGCQTKAIAQVPSDLHGTWSSKLSECADSLSENEQAFFIDRSEISWYELSCRILAFSAEGEQFTAAVDCVKGGGTRGFGTVTIRRKSHAAIHLSISNIGNFAMSFDVPLERCQPRQAPTNKRYWSHNGSVMYTIVDGERLALHYERPRKGLQEVGVRPDTLLLEGQIARGGESILATARIFTSRCGEIPYSVTGHVFDGGKRMVFLGDSPRAGEGCNVRYTKPETLEFIYLGSRKH